MWPINVCCAGALKVVGTENALASTIVTSVAQSKFGNYERMRKFKVWKIVKPSKTRSKYTKKKTAQ